MKLEITARNYKMTDRLKEIITTKVMKLDKYFVEEEAKVKVLLSGTDKRTRMEISIRYKKLQFRSEVEGDTMYYNIDECLPKLERQIVKHLKKSDDKEKLSIPNYEYISEVEEDKVEIAKVKKFQIDSITAEEAAECLDMVGHDFYLFTNVETGNVEAVYRRKDGTIGLLQPYSV